MPEAKAFSPCHITGFFQILDQPANSMCAGSIGAGVSLSDGVETIVKIRRSRRGSMQIRINGFTSNSADVSRHVIDSFLSRLERTGNLRITARHHVNLPIGAGFGTSGAAALGLALSLNNVLGLGMSKIEAAQLAHAAEVECKTGLGTVIAETFGGVEIRVKPGAPGVGEIRRIKVSRDYRIACLTLNSLPTKDFLTREATRHRINEFGGKFVNRLIEEPTITNFMRFSRQFAEQVGLITEKVRAILNATDKAGIVCSMPMFGESVFALVDRESLPDIIRIFRKYGSDRKTFVSEIDFEGARMMK